LEYLKEDIYIKLDAHVRVSHRDVCLEDMASIYCKNEALESRARKVQIFSFQAPKSGKEVISLLYVYEALQKALGEEVVLHSAGSSDCLVDLISGKKPSKLWGFIQVILVSLVTFFGAAFSIMTYNEDSGVDDVFKNLYKIFTGTEQGSGVLELTYSVGIALGVLVFFSHFEKKGQRNPTAMEIEMDKYEKDMVDAYIKSSDRRGKSLDVGGVNR
jgi:stage V sporulation protein AA